MKLFTTLFLVVAVRAQESYYENEFLKLEKLTRYKPTWEDLRKHPLPEWYDRAKIGIIIHWGVYSVPSMTTKNSEWFWEYWKQDRDLISDMRKSFAPKTTYQELATLFTAEFFDPNHWVDIFKKAGAKYVIITAKHHDGYALFPAKTSFSWNSVDSGPCRDIVGELSTAVKQQGLEFGIYYSLMEFQHPLNLADLGNNEKTNDFIRYKVSPDLMQLVHDYQPSILWSDGEWKCLDKYWNSTEFLAWLYNESPVKNKIVVNDRWGAGSRGQRGDFYSSEQVLLTRLKKHKWEFIVSLDKVSWGYRRTMDINDVYSGGELILQLIVAVSCGGNVLINIGPTKEGTIPLIFQKRLLELGRFLEINGEAIYDTSPWIHQNDSLNHNVWYTCRTLEYDGLHPLANSRRSDSITAIYAIIFGWPVQNKLYLKDVAPELYGFNYQITLLGHNSSSLKWNITKTKVVIIQLPELASKEPSYAWALKFARIRPN